MLLALAGRTGGTLPLKALSVVLTDDPGIRALNHRFLDRHDVSDVLSFRYDPVPGDDGAADAEVVINVQRAAEEGTPRCRKVRRGHPAPGFSWNPSRELALYLAHGIDHLTGADDRTAAERARMRRRELAWLRAAGVRGLLGKLLE